MKFIDFFAGCGGARRGLELAGHECIGFCEYDKFAVGAYTSMHLITEEQRAYLATLDLRKRQKEILKEEYRNGEWYANDIRTVEAGMLPKAELWAFGAPCQSFSVAGKRAGLDGESGLIREIFRLLGEIEEEDRPEWLIYENVKGMFSSNKGFDYLAILLAMDELGYDCEWQIFNSKDCGVPQNRERVYTVGHLRRYGTSKIFPIEGSNEKNSIPINIVGHRDGFRRNLQTFDQNGITEAFSTSQGGGREHHVAIPINVIGTTNPDRHSTSDIHGQDGVMSTICGRDYKQPKQIAVPLGVIDTQGRLNKKVNITDTVPTLRAESHGNLPEVVLPVEVEEPIACTFNQNNGIGDEIEVSHTLSASDWRGLNRNQDQTAICIPVITPERVDKRQNGRRFKENGDPSFTLTAQDRHGVAIGVNISGNNIVGESEISHCLNVNDQRKVFGAKQERTLVGNLIEIDTDDNDHPGIYVELTNGCIVYAVWYEKYQCYIAIRKLTPRECFRLQGWEDKYYERAEFVNSDSQLYKLAGNGITVPVMQVIGDKIRQTEGQ